MIRNYYENKGDHWSRWKCWTSGSRCRTRQFLSCSGSLVESRNNPMTIKRKVCTKSDHPELQAWHCTGAGTTESSALLLTKKEITWWPSSQRYAAPTRPPLRAPFFYLVAVNNVASVQNLTTPRGDYVSLPPRKYVELDVISPKSNAEPTGSPRCRIRGHCLHNEYGKS